MRKGSPRVTSSLCDVRITAPLVNGSFCKQRVAFLKVNVNSKNSSIDFVHFIIFKFTNHTCKPITARQILLCMRYWRNNNTAAIDIVHVIAQHNARSPFLKLAPYSNAQMTIKDLSPVWLCAIACMRLTL